MREERLNFRCAHGLWVHEFMITNALPVPEDVSILSADGRVMFWNLSSQLLL